MFITQATQASDELVEALSRLVPQVSRRMPPLKTELEEIFKSPVILMVARYPDQNGPIVGSGTLAFFRVPTGLRGHIEDVVVDQPVRGKGIGEALVDALISSAKELGIESLSLTCNPTRVAANKMYQKMGFEKRETNIYGLNLKR